MVSEFFHSLFANSTNTPKISKKYAVKSIIYQLIHLLTLALKVEYPIIELTRSKIQILKSEVGLKQIPARCNFDFRLSLKNFVKSHDYINNLLQYFECKLRN